MCIPGPFFKAGHFKTFVKNFFLDLSPDARFIPLKFSPWKFSHPITFFSVPLISTKKIHTSSFHLEYFIPFIFVEFFHTPNFYLNFHTLLIYLKFYTPYFHLNFTERRVSIMALISKKNSGDTNTPSFYLPYNIWKYGASLPPLYNFEKNYGDNQRSSLPPL